MNTRRCILFAGAFTLTLCALPSLAGQPGNLMKMTTTVHMQMPGMGAMAPMTHSMNVCTSAKRPDPSRMMQHQGDCTVTDYKKRGDTITYHMSCSGHMQMSGDGKLQVLAGGGMHGSIHIKGDEGSQAVDMDMTFDGQRIGACDYTPPKPAN